ncbi:hypothetical protein GCM10010399_82570 [Dactylosporangium fulvum]|uniref:Uncharacterized protein n=1 Tax=Dactylosporangium fulvum TaxID=53359 RepID=A0ABY5W8J2_9ACTN|nr:hypothetical protein [Dactylosporangium fulvum]UWP85872.1 hypothetical protein Dfulv_17135 [Dactylosporangium fulvum]
MAAEDEGINAGTVYVKVIPDSHGFWARFVADNQAGATAAGAELGDRIGRAIADRIARSVRDGLADGGRGLRTQGGRQGNEFGGTFADTARRRIEAALRSLPRPQIGVATNEAEQQIRDLHNDLARLSTRRVGVDISSAEALAEVRRLQTALDRVAASSPDAQVRVDTANAAIELMRLQRELDRLDGRRANARVDVDSNADAAANGMQGLIAAALALGPAIVPAAAAGTAAIVTLGSAALSAAPAVGVLALAFRGIGDAVKALSDAEQAEAKTGNTVAQQQKSLASTADQVRSAEASLANTRANAEDARRRSLQQIADAERAFGRAQDEARRAQEKLNDAREEERRAQEDTANRLRHNAVDQRKAAAEVQRLESEFARFGGEQTQLALEEARIRQDELAAGGRRLADEKARNDRTGVEGSRRVRDALDAVAQSQERIAQAERAITHAREQAASTARQQAFAIAQAQQAVANAQRSAAAATVASAATAGSALDKLDDTLNQLPVSGQRFARFLFGLKPQLDELQETAMNGVLPGAQQSIEMVLPYFADLNRWVGAVAGGIGNLEVRAARTFTDPFWRRFIAFIGDQAVPTLNLMYEAGVNVAEGGARILLQFALVERRVGEGILSLTGRFVNWSRGLDQNRGFQNFVQFVQLEGPRVMRLLGELATTGLRITQAYAPVGSVVVTELRILAQVINAIPVPVLTALAAALTAYKTAALLTAGAQAVLGSRMVQGVASMVTFRTVTDEAGRATTGMQRALGAASGFMGGPFVAALTVVGLAIGYFVAESQKAKAQINDIRQGASQYAEILKNGLTPAATEQASALLRQNAALRGLVDASRDAGVATETLVRGLNGDRQARAEVIRALDEQILREKVAAGEARKGADAENAASRKHLDRADALSKMRDAFTQSNDANAEANRLTEELHAEQSAMNQIFRDAPGPVRSLADAYQVLADRTSTAADKATALKQAEDALFGAARDADEAAVAQARAVQAANKVLDDRATITGKGAKQLDINTEAGLRLRESLREQLNAINATYRANVANGMSVEEATRKHQAEIDKLRAKTAQKGVDQKATENLIRIYGQVPTSATTDVSIRGMQTTKAQLDELLAYQLALRTGITLGEARDKIAPQVRAPSGPGQSRAGYLHTGGPVVGPGTGTSDDVPAMERTTGAPFWLSNGEFVQPAASVDYYGQGFMEAIRRRALPRTTAPGYADGGLVQQLLTEHYPFPTTVENTRIPSRGDVAAAVARAMASSSGGGFPPWPRSPSASRGDSGVWRQVVALIKATGPLSGSFGNAYRPGDPLWHGSGRGVDWMGYNQDALATFLAARRPLELIHRTKTRDYAYTRGVNKGSFNPALMEAHRNHIHIAMALGGLVNSLPFGVYDSGGRLPQGLSLAYNGTHGGELVQTNAQERASLAAHAPEFNVVLSAADPQLKALVSMIDVRVERKTGEIARQISGGVRA